MVCLRRAVAVALSAAALSLTLGALPAFAEWEVSSPGDFKYELHSDGTVTVTGLDVHPDFDPEPTSIVVPETIGGHVVTAIGDRCFYNSDRYNYYGYLEEVSLPSTLTSIGDDAFYRCWSLSSVNIPEGVTSIGDDAFYSCVSLRDVSLPSTLTSIGDGAFSHCDSLESVNIPEGVTSIGDDAFYSCGSQGDPAFLSAHADGVSRAYALGGAYVMPDRLFDAIWGVLT